MFLPEQYEKGRICVGYFYNDVGKPCKLSHIDLPLMILGTQ